MSKNAKEKETYVQYIILRSDIDSMTAGRCAAQAAHASTVMTNRLSNSDSMPFMQDKYIEWANSTPQGFGTTIVLKTHLWNSDKTEIAKKLSESTTVTWHEVVTDPEYFIKDGSINHIVKDVETAMVIFGPKKFISQEVVKNLSLL